MESEIKNSKIGCMESNKKNHELNEWNQKENNLEIGCMESNKKIPKLDVWNQNLRVHELNVWN
jgi:hypothetical protein